MKKFTLLVLITLLSTVSFAGSVTTTGKMGKRSENCTGLGICMVTTTSTGHLTRMNFNYIPDQHLLTLSFSISELGINQPEQAALLEGQTSFPMEEPFTLSAEVSAQLGSASPIVIPTGNYPISQEGGTYSITIQL